MTVETLEASWSGYLQCCNERRSDDHWEFMHDRLLLNVQHGRDDSNPMPPTTARSPTV